jgi:hypothetical protein
VDNHYPLTRLAGIHESTPDEQNGPHVICVAIWRNLRNLRTIEKADTKDPLITLIMDARNLRTARAYGVSAR